MGAQSNVVVPNVVIYIEPLAEPKVELRHLRNAPEPPADYVTLITDLFHADATMYLERLLGNSLDRSV